MYILLLLAEPKYVSCVRLTEVIEDLSHDSVNRFLLPESDLRQLNRQDFRRIHDSQS
jgi:hypothetical protein